jgi:hypothetical protein
LNRRPPEQRCDRDYEDYDFMVPFQTLRQSMIILARPTMVLCSEARLSPGRRTYIDDPMRKVASPKGANESQHPRII